MDGRDLARLIEREQGISPEDLADKLGVSTRTLRTWTSKANGTLSGIAEIECRRGAGYHIKVLDQLEYARWKRAGSSLAHAGSNAAPSAVVVPQTHDDRISYLVVDLLSRNNWITIDELSSVLYISRATVSKELRSIEGILSRFDLTIERRPNRGIRIQGSEFNRRLALASVIVNRLVPGQEEVTGRRRLDVVTAAVDDITRREGYALNRSVYQNLVVHLSVALARIEQGKYVPFQPDNLERISETLEYGLAMRIAERIGSELGLDFPREEIAYIAIHLAGKRLLPADTQDEGGSVISDEVWGIVSKMLDVVWNAFRFDFRFDLELRMNLARHIVPLSARVRYHMNLENPMLADIKAKYPLAYAMAAESAVVLERAYDGVLSEDEVGYLALAFALAVENHTERMNRKRLLVVCASGTASSRLLEHRLIKRFGESIEHIETCDAESAAAFDYATVDYVFTTVPLAVNPPVPVCQISLFFEEGEADQLETMLSDHPHRIGAERYFDPALFFPHLELTTREEALLFLCKALIDAHRAPASLTGLVFQREALFDTAFGNLMALPHAIEAVGNRTEIAVGLFDHEIDWAGKPVRCVMLISFARDPEPDITELYRTIAAVFESEGAIRNLLAGQRFETFIHMLREF